MYEVIFAIVAACIALAISGFLFTKQKECYEKRLKADKEVDESLAAIAESIEILKDDRLLEHSLSYLEEQVDSLTKSLRFVNVSGRGRRNRHAKHKIHLTDD